MIYICRHIWIIITSFLGNNYWKNRQELTYLSHALDFASSDYTTHSYWLWHKWREKKQNNWYFETITICKPLLPHRFNIKKNPYIASVDPPKLTEDYSTITYRHKLYRKKVYFNDNRNKI